MPPSPEDPLVSQAFDTKKHEDLARAIEKLTPEEAEFFLHKLERALRKRKIQVTGYLAAMLSWVLGTAFALWYYGSHDGFVGWVFLAPFGVVGVILYAFGAWAERVAKAPPLPRAAVEPATAPSVKPSIKPSIEPSVEPSIEPSGET